MTNEVLTVAPPVDKPKGSRIAGHHDKTLAQKILAGLGTGIVNVVLLIVAIFWLVPSVGLLITSLRSTGDNSSSGWWTVFTKPAELTIENYANLLQNSTIVGSFWNTIVIAVPTTILVVLIGALAAYAFAWMKFPGRDWLLIVVIVLLAVPIQVALIPLARLFGTLGIFGSVVGVILFAYCVRVTVCDLPAAKLFHPGARRTARSGPHRWCTRLDNFLQSDAAAGASRDRIARNLPVFVDLERHACRVDFHKQ